MRMRNPFSGDPGDEETNGNAAGDDPLEPPRDDGEAETRAAETRAGETRAGETHVSQLKAEDGAAESSDSQAGDDEPSAEKKSDGDEQELTAPSVGPHTVIDKPPPEERLDFDKISDVDAMGQEKRREVVGKTYGPTKARVFATFAGFFAVVGALAVGFYLLAKELDQPPAENVDAAPWSCPAVEGEEEPPPCPQIPAKELQ